MSGTTVFRMSFSVAMMCLTRKFAASLMLRLSYMREKNSLKQRPSFVNLVSEH